MSTTNVFVKEHLKPNRSIIQQLLSAMGLHEYSEGIWSPHGYTKKTINAPMLINSFLQKFRNKRSASIEEIFNPYTKLLFELKRLDTGIIGTLDLYHGTSAVDKICMENLNYRYSGRSRGHKFGKGVSFSGCPFYASHYTTNKMFYCSVIYSRHSIGKFAIVLPSEGCDTTANIMQSVYVKYHDDSFYPKYLITYL